MYDVKKKKKKTSGVSVHLNHVGRESFHQTLLIYLVGCSLETEGFLFFIFGFTYVIVWTDLVYVVLRGFALLSPV